MSFQPSTSTAPAGNGMLGYGLAVRLLVMVFVPWGLASLPHCPGIVLASYAASLNTYSDLQQLWCAILGLNQSRLAKRRGRFRLICYLRTFAVAWPMAERSASSQLAAFVEQFIDLTT